MSRAIVALLLVGLVAATQETAKTTDAPTLCFQYTTCSTCTGAPSGECGWLPATQECHHGTPSGPDNFTVPSEMWNWDSADCCSSSLHCYECTTVNGESCNWNVERGACESVWRQSSASSSSNNGNGLALIGSTGTCPSTCEAAVDCDTCIGMMNCGWSSDLEMCLAGSSAGPYNTPSMRYYGYLSWHTTSCSSRNWQLRWSVNSYPLWCIVGGASVVALFASIVAGRRRRRLLLEQRRRGAAAPYAAVPQAQPTVATPLVNEVQGDYTGHLVYGQLLPTPYYGVAPDTTISADEVPIAKPQ